MESKNPELTSDEVVETVLDKLAPLELRMFKNWISDTEHNQILKKLTDLHDVAVAEQPKQATHEELCDAALRHYMELSDEVCRYLSTIPEAIEFYKKHGEKMVIDKDESDSPLPYPPHIDHHISDCKCRFCVTDMIPHDQFTKTPYPKPNGHIPK